jgi:hypothetical protein
MTARLFDKFRRVLPFALLFVYIAQFTSYMAGVGGIEPYVRSMDFMPNLAAAEMIIYGHGDALYDLDAQRARQLQVLSPYYSLDEGELLPFNHLPFEAFLIVPFMFLSYAGVTLYWTLLLASALLASLFLLQRTLPLKRSWLVVVVICAVTYLPVFRAFILGQNSPIVLLGICLVFAACRRGLVWCLWLSSHRWCL